MQAVCWHEDGPEEIDQLGRREGGNRHSQTD